MKNSFKETVGDYKAGDIIVTDEDMYIAGRAGITSLTNGDFFRFKYHYNSVPKLIKSFNETIKDVYPNDATEIRHIGSGFVEKEVQTEDTLK